MTIYDGSTLLSTILANSSRGDSAAIGAAVGSGDNGLHAFSIPFPTALKTGLPRAIGVRFESTSVELSNSPKSITCVHPRGEVGTAVTAAVLVVDFKLQNGAPSAKGRLVGLNFNVRERTGATSHDVTAEVTHYRTLESPDLRNADLSGQSWTPLPGHGLIHVLAERNGAGERYGERKIMFQVKTDTLTSSIVSDTIVLEPVLKEYTVSASGSTHPLIQYAASQGFTFPLDYYETCSSQCGSNTVSPTLASGSASFTVEVKSTGASAKQPEPVACAAVGAVVGAVAAPEAAPLTATVGAVIGGLVCSIPPSAPASTGTCATKADYLLFEARSPNQFWRIKSVDVPGTHVVGHGANRFRVKFSFDNKDATCFGPKQISIGDVVVEGPEVDDFVDMKIPKGRR